MRDINKLKKLNLLEKLGFLIKKKPKQSIMIFSAMVLVFALFFSMPYFINLSKEHKAKKLIENISDDISRIDNERNEALSLLEENKRYYKDLLIYQSSLKEDNKELKELKDELSKYKRKLEDKKIKSILEDFNTKENKNAFPLLVEKHYNKYKPTYEEITSVYKITNELIKNEKDFVALIGNYPFLIDKKDKELRNVLQKGKNKRVKDNTQKKYNDITKNNTNFVAVYDKSLKFQKDQIGNFNLTELESLLNEQKKTVALLSKHNSLTDSFDTYYNELQEQYYTVVTDNDYAVSTDNVTEPNPSYKEWQEQESYQTTETKYKTETYTERVYVGSRMVGNTKQDVYENQTKTRQVPYEVPVTKQRTVTKNNGQPKTISVPYDLYKFYYTIKTVKPNGTSNEEVYVGKKHEKYDSSLTHWSYDTNEEEGYVVWKQKWNDNEGIVKGFNIDAELEK